MRRSRLVRAGSCCLLVVGLVFSGSGVPAQPAKDLISQAKLVGSSPRAAARLAGVQAKVEQKKWAEAVAEYQSILDEDGNELMPASADSPNHFVSVRFLCQARLAALPPAALRLYRARVDEQTKKRLDPAVQNRDVAGLRRIVAETFCSRPAERAIDLLGDLAFERCDFHDAERWWRLLALPGSELQPPRDQKKASGPVLLYPDPQSDLALIRAKQILALLFRGDRALAIEELKAYRALHAKAEGPLAGRNGVYAETLQGFAERKDFGSPILEDLAWPTFAGDPTRNPPVLPLPRCRWLEEPWRVRLDGKPVDGKPEPSPAKTLNATEAAKLLAFQPVVVGDHVLVADARFVTVFDLLTGRMQTRFDLLDEVNNGGLKLDASLPVKSEVRYTLTVADRRIYVRLGTPALRLAGEPREAADAADSYLFCLQLPAVANDPLTVRWQVASRGQDKEIALFEGAPLVHAGRVYVARTRLARAWFVTDIDCYDAETGVRRWRQEVCEANELVGENEARPRQQLLSLAGPNVVYCSHSGAIVALDLATGQRSWAVRYPRRGYHLADGMRTPRDLCPCLYAHGRVYAAPADSDRILSLDVATGRTLWESRSLEVVHLLGVGHNRLILTTGTKPRGIRALDASTGEDLRSWLQPDDGGDLASLGRGLLAGGRVLWPTSGGLQIIDQETGRVNDIDRVPLSQVKPGNLAVGNGCLVVANDRELLGYVAPGRLLEQRRKDAAAQPESARALYRLALAEADAGLSVEGMVHFAKAWDMAAALPDGQPRDTLRAAITRDAIRLMQTRLDVATPEESAALLQGLGEGLSSSLPRSVLTWASCQLLRSAQPEAAVKGWQTLLRAPGRPANVPGPDGLAQPFSTHAVAQIEALKRTHGVALYRTWENEAQGLLTASGDQPDTALVERLADAFPNATVTKAAVRRLAARQEEVGRHAAAADLQRLLYTISEPSEQALPLARLARAYENQHLWDAARLTWQRLNREHGGRVVEQLNAKLAVRDVVTRQLERPEYRTAPTACPELAVPLDRAWHVALSAAENERLLVPAVAPLGVPDYLFFVRQPTAPGRDVSALLVADAPADPTIANVLTCRDAGTGKAIWQVACDLPIAWIGHHANVVLAAGAHGVICLRPSDGKVLWTFPALGWPDAGSATAFTAFQLADARLFLLQDERRLIALDVETGRVLWHHWAPGAQLLGGRFHPDYFAGKERVLIQTARGTTWLLDAGSGQWIRETEATQPGNWLRPPLPLDERQACLVPDAQHIVLLDLETGDKVWTHAIDRRTSLTGEAPQLQTDGQALLLCVARNIGFELQRLDVKTGQPRWSKPVPLRGERPRLAALDTSAVYLVADNVLAALALDDGQRRWEVPLSGPADGWRVVVARRYLLVHPLQAQLEVEAGTLLRRFLSLDVSAVFPTQSPCSVGKVLTGLVVASRLAQSPSRFNVLLCDPRDGQVLERLNFVSRGPDVAVNILDRRIAVSLHGTAWGLQ